MDFIRTYFNTKIGALGKLLLLTKDAWDQRIWGAVVLMVLWTLFCTIGGMLFFPIDFIYSAVMWHKHPEFREIVKDLEEELALD